MGMKRNNPLMAPIEFGLNHKLKYKSGIKCMFLKNPILIIAFSFDPLMLIVLKMWFNLRNKLRLLHDNKNKQREDNAGNMSVDLCSVLNRFLTELIKTLLIKYDRVGSIRQPGKAVNLR